MNSELIIACVDVDYRETVAVAAGVWFRGWTATEVEMQAVAVIEQVNDYEPGAFYRRELPCLLEVLSRGPKADIVIVDGYVWLGDGIPGLGAHLHEAIGGIVVGVAKTRFHSAEDAVPVVRGGSLSPLFVSAVGMDAQRASECIQNMDGPYRLPTMLQNVDRAARTA